MVYWKVKDMASGNECKDGIGYEGIFYINKFESKEEAIKFIKSLPHQTGHVNPYKIFRFDDKKGTSMQDYDITYKAFNGAWMTLTGRYMGRNKEEAIKIFKSKTPHGEIISIAKIDKYGMPTKPKKVGKGWHESPGADGKAPVHKEVAERAQAKHAQNTPMKKQGYFIIIEDRMGNITLSHSGSKRVAFFQAESDKEFISDLLKKDEKEDMENGYGVKINDSEPRASTLSELWEASGGG